MMAMLLIITLPLTAFAEVIADVSLGNVTIHDTQVEHTTSEGTITEDHGGSVTVTGSSTTNTVQVTTVNNDVTVRLDDVTITRTGVGATAMSVDRGEGTTVTVELDGTNSLKSGTNSAGLQTSGAGELVIQDESGEAGSLTATGGSYGAGIGGGGGQTGTGITITGGEVTAYGGESASGIGGGGGGNGETITISGGEVTATGGKDATGIGGGAGGTGSEITIKNDAVVTATGSNLAADIGDGPYNGCTEKQLNKADVSGLYTTGSVNGSPGNTDPEEIPPQDEEKPDQPSQSEGASAAEAGYCAPLYRVIDEDGKDIPHQDSRKDGVLTITANEDFASLIGTLGGMKALKAQGVNTIVFVTNGASSSFAIEDLLEHGSIGERYSLTHDGSTVTFTLRNGTDISKILK